MLNVDGSQERFTAANAQRTQYRGKRTLLANDEAGIHGKKLEIRKPLCWSLCGIHSSPSKNCYYFCLPSDNVSYMFLSDMSRILQFCNSLSPPVPQWSLLLFWTNRCPTLFLKTSPLITSLSFATPLLTLLLVDIPSQRDWHEYSSQERNPAWSNTPVGVTSLWLYHK